MAKLQRKLLASRKRAGETLVATTPIFVRRLGRRLSARQLRHAFEVWQERAGFERDDAALRLARGGNDGDARGEDGRAVDGE